MYPPYNLDCANSNLRSFINNDTVEIGDIMYSLIKPI